MHSRRALLYMPGDDRRKIEKSTTLDVDSICMDMEDGVAANRKAEARAVIAQAMKELDFGKSERCIRINSIGSGIEKFDLASALTTNPDAIVVPKIESAEQVKWVSDHIETHELASKKPIGTVRLLVGVETAKGILNLREIASADKRLEAIIFGGEDYAASIGAVRTKSASELMYARQATITVCAANDLQALDISKITKVFAPKRSREQDSVSAGNRSFTRIRFKSRRRRSLHLMLRLNTQNESSNRSSPVKKRVRVHTHSMAR